MVINQDALLELAPIKDMLRTKEKSNGCSYGLSEAGYDIRIKQGIHFIPQQTTIIRIDETGVPEHHIGNFVLASAMEEFDMPNNLVGIVHDKSTWARRRLSVFNTVIEPGWKGFLTLELVYHGDTDLIIPAGTGIAQVIFHELAVPMVYDGKYQHAGDHPCEAIHE